MALERAVTLEIQTLDTDNRLKIHTAYKLFHLYYSLLFPNLTEQNALGHSAEVWSIMPVGVEEIWTQLVFYTKILHRHHHLNGKQAETRQLIKEIVYIFSSITTLDQDRAPALIVRSALEIRLATCFPSNIPLEQWLQARPVIGPLSPPPISEEPSLDENPEMGDTVRNFLFKKKNDHRPLC